MIKMSNRSRGSQYEDWVGKQLEKKGYKVLDTNFRSPYGEIDIVAVHNNVLVLVEVKARSSALFGQPYEAVNVKKLSRIAKTGHYYREETGKKLKLPAATRIDVVSVVIEKEQMKSMEVMENVTR